MPLLPQTKQVRLSIPFMALTVSEIRCSGDLPRCSVCEKTNRPCIYEANKKDRLESAHDRIEDLVTLLQDLRGNVGGEDQARIKNVLSEHGTTAPESVLKFPSAPSTSSDSALFSDDNYDQQSTTTRLQSQSNTSRTSDVSSPMTVDNSQTLAKVYAPSHYMSVDDTGGLVILAEQDIATRSPEVPHQICEAQWLASLKKRLENPNSVPLAATPLPDYTDYHFDGETLKLTDAGNPFELPEETVTIYLVQYYFRTIHPMFPIVTAHVEAQLQNYYQMTRSGAFSNIVPLWYAIVNLILAIGGRYLKISNDRSIPGTFDETLCVARAYRLMEFNDSTLTLKPPDLTSVHSIGLLALYYLAAGRVTRAWMMAGTALRFALAIGLHLQKQHASHETSHTITATQTWWSIYNLETFLSSLIGRPCMVRHEDIATTLPSDLANTNYQADTLWTPTMAFLDTQIRISSLTQKVMSSLYNERRTPLLWSTIHASMTQLLAELESMCLTTQFTNAQDDADQIMFSKCLQKQHIRLKILITRPSLQRIERCAETDVHDFSQFDLAAAVECIQTAQYAASLLPVDMDLKSLYESGPWCIMVHLLLQPLSILLSALSLQSFFPAHSFPSSLTSVKKLVTALRVLAPGNELAQRAFRVIQDIVLVPVQKGPSFWTDVAALFPEEKEGDDGEM